MTSDVGSVMRRILIVGNGIAGLTAADTLRAHGFDGDLTIVGAEHHAPYSRPALSKAALLDVGEMTSHELPEPGHEAVVMPGVAAVGLDVARRRVQLDDGDDLGYDGLVIASGARARRFGVDIAAEHTMRTIEDAIGLRAVLGQSPSVVVIGSGPLGWEVASGCISHGVDVTVVSDGPPLSRLLGGFLSDLFVRAAVDHGLKIITGTAVGVRDGAGDGAQVTLLDGSVLAADIVVSAIGDVPNVEWLTDAGLLVDGALTVDRRGRIPGHGEIVAAGDVACFPTTRGVRRVPLWTSAIDQAKVAAVALLRGEDAPSLDFFPYFWTEGFGLSLKASGWLPVEGEPDEVLGGDPAGTGAGLMRWRHGEADGAAVALNHRMAVPALKRLAKSG